MKHPTEMANEVTGPYLGVGVEAKAWQGDGPNTSERGRVTGAR